MAHVSTRRCGTAVVAVAVALLAVPDAIGAAAQPRLGKPVTLVGRTGLSAPMTMTAAASANGLQAFAWVRFRPAVDAVPSGFGGPSSVVQTRLRRADGRLSRVQSVSPGTGRAFVPAIGVDARRGVTAVWLQQVHRGTFSVVVSVRRPGGRFGQPVSIGRTRVPTIRALYPDVLPYDYGAQPALAVAADGAAVVAWRGSNALQVAVRRPGRCPARARRACFSRPQVLPPGAEPRVVFGVGDRAYVVWAAPHGASGGIDLAVARVGGSFTPTRVSAAGVTASHPSIAVTPDGTAIVVWQAEQAHRADVQASVRSISGMLSTPTTLSDGGSGPSVVASALGEAIAVWQQETVPETGGGIATAVWSSGGFAPSQVVDTAQSSDPIIAVDGRGDAVLAYVQGAAGFGDWLLRPPRGAFGSADPLPGSPEFVVKRKRDAVTLGVLQDGRTRLYDVLLD